MRIISIMFALFVVAYIGVSVRRSLYKPIQTVRAVNMESQDAIELEGFIVREEKPLSAAVLGAIEMQIGEGERAAKGDVVAALYESDAVLANSKKKKALDARISKLQSLMCQGNEVFDLKTIDENITRLTENVLSLMEQGRFGELDTEVVRLRDKTMSREYIYRDKNELGQVISKLQAERKQYENAQPKKLVYAPSPGYYSHETDGYEGILARSQISEFTPNKLKELDNKKALPNQNDGVMGKIVSNFTWNYVARVKEKNADMMKEGARVFIRFDNHLYPDVPAVVEWISSPESGYRTVSLLISEHISDFTLPRKLAAEVVVKTYSGLKVPREAMRVNEKGEKGVYCLIESQVKFKKVEPIFEKDSYYIVKYDSADTKSLLLFDEIIISAKELSHKKVIR